jgi:hypothetical protein
MLLFYQINYSNAYKLFIYLPFIKIPLHLIFLLNDTSFSISLENNSLSPIFICCSHFSTFSFANGKIMMFTIYQMSVSCCTLLLHRKKAQSSLLCARSIYLILFCFPTKKKNTQKSFKKII